MFIQSALSLEDLLPESTDPAAWATRSAIKALYLARIAQATESEKRPLICEMVAAVYDLAVQPKLKEATSLDDIDDFRVEMGLVVGAILHYYRNTEEALFQAILVMLGARAEHWTSIAIERLSRARVEPAGDRGAAIKDYIREVWRLTGKLITKSDISRAAGYKTRTEFERWQRGDAKATPTANQN